MEESVEISSEPQQDVVMEDATVVSTPSALPCVAEEVITEEDNVPPEPEKSTENEATVAPPQTQTQTEPQTEPQTQTQTQSQTQTEPQTQTQTVVAVPETNGQVEITPSSTEQTFQHVELHIVDSDEEAADLRVKLLATPDQNVHLLACARELHVAGIVPTQMDAMAGTTPLFTYVLSTDFMGAAQEIARSLVSGVESAQQQHDAEVKRTRNAAKGVSAKAEKSLDVYDFDDDAKTKPATRKRKKMTKSLTKNDVLEEDETKESVEEGVASLAKRNKKGGTEIKCLYCPYSTGKKYLLIRHMRCHSEERPHPCTQPGCSRAFKTTSSLQNHINTHSGVKPHTCKYVDCGASFTTSGELVRHSRYKHTHEKPHKCTHEGCGYSSVEMSKLRRHLRSHTGERPFKCPHCDYASPDTYKLKRHLRVHTGEKPYECDICHHKFTQSNSMKAHRMIHEAVKPVFQCQLCPAKCSRKTDLKIHVQKLHQSDQPVVCKKCGKSFADRYLFNLHRKSDSQCGGKKGVASTSATPRGKGKARKKRGASVSSDTTDSDSEMVSPETDEEEGDGGATVMEETEPELEAGFHSVRCVLPGGDVVHIIHNGAADADTRVVTLKTALPPPSAVEENDVVDAVVDEGVTGSLAEGANSVEDVAVAVGEEEQNGAEFQKGLIGGEGAGGGGGGAGGDVSFGEAETTVNGSTDIAEEEIAVAV